MSIDKPHKLIADTLYNLSIAIPISLCYNINVPREIKRSQRTNKKIQKSLKKVLTNLTPYGIIKTKKRVATYRKERN